MWQRRHETVPPRQGSRLEADRTGKIPMPLRSEVSHWCHRMGPSWELGKEKSYSAIIWTWSLVLCDVFGDCPGSLSLLALRFRSARSCFNYSLGHYSYSVLVDERFILARCDCVNLANASRHEYSLRLSQVAPKAQMNGVLGNCKPGNSHMTINGVVSRGRCNTGLQFIRWSLKSQGFSWTLIQPQSDFVEVRLRELR